MADSETYEITLNYRLAYFGDGRFATFRLPRDVPEIEIKRKDPQPK